MRIDHRYTPESAGPDSGKPAGKVRADSGSVPKDAGSGSVSRDLIALSEGRDFVIQALRSEETHRSGRIEQLRGEVHSGRYTVDARELSRILVAETLGG